MSDREMCLRNELALEIDDYNQPKVYEGFNSLGMNIVHLLFLKQGTYPNLPDMGINIESYNFEFIDDRTLGELELLIKEQIMKYLISNGYVDLVLKILTDNEDRKVLGLAFTISNDSNDPETVKIFLTQNTKNNEVIASFKM